MSWDSAVEAEEITSGERALVGDARGGNSGGSRTWEVSSPSGPLGDAKACNKVRAIKKKTTTSIFQSRYETKAQVKQCNLSYVQVVQSRQQHSRRSSWAAAREI